MPAPRSPIQDVMSHGAIAVDEKLTLRALASVLADLDIGAVLVAGPDGVAEIVSERDVIRALAADADPEEIWAADVARSDLVLAAPEESVLDVAERMSDEGVRHIAVVKHGTIVGVVSLRDLVPVLTNYVRTIAAL